MNYDNILNEEQLRAVKCTEGPVMVSAGAGSGKTRLLTYRIAYLITECHVMPYNILAITFTNKASREMKERIERVAPDGNLVTVATFHSFCAKLLRQYASFLDGYNSNYTIYSDTDINKIFKQIFANYEIIDETQKENIRHHIEVMKNDNLTIDEYCKINQYAQDIVETKKVYLDYQAELKKNNAMDFDDLLINFYNLIKTNKDILETIQNRFQYISVDEFQDTNKLQYQIIRLLASKYQNILIVGDEDQSIYSWRGANIGNIYSFKTDFKDVKVFKLEKNYRSTKAVLDKANMLIKNNKDRIDKTLYTENDQGQDVEYYLARDEQDEADFVVRKILHMNRAGVSFDDMAILLRLNALTKPFEDKLLLYNVPYRMYNSFKFYERAEIKSTLAYLICIANPSDNNSVARLINFPSRHIGDASIEKLRAVAEIRNCTLKDVILGYENEDFPKALKSKLEGLKALILDIEEKSKTMNAYDIAKYIVEVAHIQESFDKKDEKEYEKSLNIDSLLLSIKNYVDDNPDASIIDYLQTVSLTTEIDRNDETKGVVIATVHGAKGLEFDTVFVSGLEENIFPIHRDNTFDLEEERRLMYVAITRAKRYLCLTSSSSRFMYGRRDYSLTSRFLKEIGMVTDKPKRDRYFSYDDYENANSYGKGNYSNNYNSPYAKQNSFQSGVYGNKPFNNSYSSTYKSSQNISSVNNGNNMSGLNKGLNIPGLSKGFGNIKKKELDISKVKVGASVLHPKFGKGVIVSTNSFASNKCVDINFEKFGNKSLSLDYAPIEFED